MKKWYFLVVSLKMGYLHEFNSDSADQIGNLKLDLSSLHKFNKNDMLLQNNLVKNRLKGRVSKSRKNHVLNEGRTCETVPFRTKLGQKNTLEIFIFFYFLIAIKINFYYIIYMKLSEPKKQLSEQK